jgi:hypothetical protein
MTFKEMKRFAEENAGKEYLIRISDEETYDIFTNKGWQNATYNEWCGPEFSLLPVNMDDPVPFPDCWNEAKQNIDADKYSYYTITIKAPEEEIKSINQIIDQDLIKKIG